MLNLKFIIFKIPVMIGVFVNSIFDIDFSLTGQIIGLAGVALSSLYSVVRSTLIYFQFDRITICNKNLSGQRTSKEF